MTKPYNQYAVLMSSASAEVYADLVCSTRHETAADAHTDGEAIVAAQPGIQFWVMESQPRGWVEVGGERDARTILQSLSSPTSTTSRTLTKAESQPMCRYGATAALTYLRDSPAGVGPWFVVTTSTSTPYADHRDAIAAWELADAPAVEADEEFGWIITKDLIADKDEPEGTNLNAVGVAGPRGISEAMIAKLDSRKGRAFRMYDDDGEHYYSGRFVGDDDSEDAFAPLENFGTPNAGCTRIDYAYEGGVWKTL